MTLSLVSRGAVCIFSTFKPENVFLTHITLTVHGLRCRAACLPPLIIHRLCWTTGDGDHHPATNHFHIKDRTMINATVVVRSVQR